MIDEKAQGFDANIPIFKLIMPRVLH